MSFLSDLRIQDALPAGVIFPFAGTTPPSGWLLCDGTSYLQGTYPRLFAAIGSAHGSNAANTFNVPDFRGRFLRGTDNMGSGAAGRDPNTGTRSAANTGGNTGNAVGSVQANATAKNGLSDSGHSHPVPGAYWVYNGGAGTRLQNVAGTEAAISNQPATTSVSANLTSTDAETRPLNAYVNYIIKI